MKFKIACEEVRMFEVLVEADTLEEAKDELFHNPSIYIGEDQGEYVRGSFNINDQFTDFLNGVK